MKGREERLGVSGFRVRSEGLEFRVQGVGYTN